MSKAISAFIRIERGVQLPRPDYQLVDALFPKGDLLVEDSGEGER
jgi:hypothetical protein